MNAGQSASRYDQAAIWGTREGRDSALDLACIAYAEGAQLHSERRRHGLNCAPEANSAGYRRVAKHCHARHAWRDLFQQLQPFRADAEFPRGKTGDVASWPRQAFDEAGPNRIGGPRKHDRHGASRLQQRRYDRAPRSQDDVRRERDQFRRVSAEEFGIARAPTILDPHVTADGPTQFLQALKARRVASRSFRIVRAQVHEHADAPHPLALLRPRRQRPPRRAAEQRDEFAPSHSITSSARASTLAGTSRPSAFAVFRLMTSSYLVGVCTGRSAGFSPLRMRSM